MLGPSVLLGRHVPGLGETGGAGSGDLLNIEYRTGEYRISNGGVGLGIRAYSFVIPRSYFHLDWTAEFIPPTYKTIIINTLCINYFRRNKFRRPTARHSIFMIRCSSVRYSKKAIHMTLLPKRTGWPTGVFVSVCPG